jgi:FRG domain
MPDQWEEIMKWETRTIDRFQDFVDEIYKLMPTATALDERCWFRGQTNAEWDLVTSYTRSSCKLGLSDEALTELEFAARMAFRSQAHLFVRPSLLAKVKTIPCWWALMQHHGAPTRLLDWTLSPFVAAYFAVQQDGTREPGAVWGFCCSELRRACEADPDCGPIPDFDASGAPEWYERRLKTLSGRKIVIPLTFGLASSERIVAQQGRFTMSFNINESHNCMISQIGPGSLRKILIPHERKPEFLLRLRNMNITGGSLFPGVDGLGQSVRELVSLGTYYHKALP